MNNNPKLNAEGYHDPTAYEALKPVIREDEYMRHRVSSLIDLMRRTADMCGFEVVGRVALKYKKTGKEYR